MRQKPQNMLRATFAMVMLCMASTQAGAQGSVNTSTHAFAPPPFSNRAHLEQSLRQARAEWRMALEHGDAQGIDQRLLINALGAQRRIIVRKIIEREHVSRQAGVRLTGETLRLLSTRQKGRLLLAELEYERSHTHPLHGNKAVPSNGNSMAVHVAGIDGWPGRWYFPISVCFTADNVLEHPERFFDGVQLTWR